MKELHKGVRRSVIHNPDSAESLHPLHLPQDLALVGGQQGAVVWHLLEHGAALELVAGFLEVVPASQTRGIVNACRFPQTTKTQTLVYLFVQPVFRRLNLAVWPAAANQSTQVTLEDKASFSSSPPGLIITEREGKKWWRRGWEVTFLTPVMTLTESYRKGS